LRDDGMLKSTEYTYSLSLVGSPPARAH
jgi:hypothetical protein